MAFARRPGPLGMDPTGGSLRDSHAGWGGLASDRGVAPMCLARASHTPGPLGLNDSADPTRGRMSQLMRPPAVERGPDHVILVIEASPLASSPSDGSELETTAENLARFLYDQRTNWPGGVLDSIGFAKELKELGAPKFQVKDLKNGKKALSFRVLARHLSALGKSIRTVFAELTLARVVAESKAALRSGAKGTGIAFVVVGAIDVVHELLQDEPCLRRLGVDLAVDTLKLLASLLAGAIATGALVTVGASALTIAGVGLTTGVGVGLLLDGVDASFGLTQRLQDAAETLQREGEWGLQRFLYQLEHAIRSRVGIPYY